MSLVEWVHAWGVEPFVEFEFMRRALFGCFALCLSAVPVGVFLMLRRMSLVGDAMSHAILPGVAAGFLISGMSVMAMTIGGVIAGCLVALLAGLSARVTATAEDVNLAVFYLVSMAFGVWLITLKGTGVDLMHVLFGNMLALDNEAVWLLTIFASFTMIVVSIIYRGLVMSCLDSAYYESVSKRAPWVYFIFLVLIVVNLVGGFNAMGTMMSVGLMIIPGACARFWVVRLEAVIGLAVVLALVACYLGLVLSYSYSSPTGSLIVLIMGGMYALSALLGYKKGVFPNWLRQRAKHFTH